MDCCCNIVIVARNFSKFWYQQYSVSSATVTKIKNTLRMSMQVIFSMLKINESGMHLEKIVVQLGII